MKSTREGAADCQLLGWDLGRLDHSKYLMWFEKSDPDSIPNLTKTSMYSKFLVEKKVSYLSTLSSVWPRTISTQPLESSIHTRQHQHPRECGSSGTPTQLACEWRTRVLLDQQTQNWWGSRLLCYLLVTVRFSSLNSGPSSLEDTDVNVAERECAVENQDTCLWCLFMGELSKTPLSVVIKRWSFNFPRIVQRE